MSALAQELTGGFAQLFGQRRGELESSLGLAAINPGESAREQARAVAKLIRAADLQGALAALAPHYDVLAERPLTSQLLAQICRHMASARVQLLRRHADARFERLALRSVLDDWVVVHPNSEHRLHLLEDRAAKGLDVQRTACGNMTVDFAAGWKRAAIGQWAAERQRPSRGNVCLSCVRAQARTPGLEREAPPALFDAGAVIERVARDMFRALAGEFRARASMDIAGVKRHADEALAPVAYPLIAQHFAALGESPVRSALGGEEAVARLLRTRADFKVPLTLSVKAWESLVTQALDGPIGDFRTHLGLELFGR